MALVWSVSLVVRMILGVLIFGMATAAIVGNSVEPDAPWSLILGLSCPLIQVLGAVYSTYAIVWTHEWASYKINQHSQPLMALPCVIFGSVTFVTVFSAPAHLSPPWVADTPLRIVVVTLSSWLISSLFVLSFFSSSALHRPEAIAYAYAALWLAFIFFAKFWAPRAAVTLLIFFSSLISYITSAIRDCLSAPMTRQTISAVETTSLLYAEEVLDSPENAAAEPSSSSHIASGKCLLPLHALPDSKTDNPPRPIQSERSNVPRSSMVTPPSYAEAAQQV